MKPVLIFMSVCLIALLAACGSEPVEPPREITNGAIPQTLWYDATCESATAYPEYREPLFHQIITNANVASKGLGILTSSQTEMNNLISLYNQALPTAATWGSAMDTNNLIISAFESGRSRIEETMFGTTDAGADANLAAWRQAGGDDTPDGRLYRLYGSDIHTLNAWFSCATAQLRDK